FFRAQNNSCHGQDVGNNRFPVHPASPLVHARAFYSRIPHYNFIVWLYLLFMYFLPITSRLDMQDGGQRNKISIKRVYVASSESGRVNSLPFFVVHLPLCEQRKAVRVKTFVCNP